MFDDMFEEEFDDSFESAPAEAPPSLRAPRETTEMFGNAATEQTLLSLYNNNTLPHALIFAGPMGVGKCTMAFRLARFLLKHGAQDGDENQDSLFGAPEPKEQPTSLYVDANDPVYAKVASGGHPDLRYVERSTDSKTGIKKSVLDVDTIREIAPFLRKTTAEGGWRIAIVDEADSMNRNAQNAILKILEEPPSKALIILVCNRLGAMLPTIRSRCRVFHFAPLATDDFAPLLSRAAPSMTRDDLETLSAIADGSIGRAQTLIDEGGVKMLQTLISFLEGWPRWNWAKIHPMADTLSKNDADKAYAGFATIFEWIAESFLRYKATGAKNLPKILAGQELEGVREHYSLEQWIEICERLKNHFTAIEQSNLDKRHGVIGAFSILG